MLRSFLQSDAEPEIREFSPQLPDADVRDVVTAQKLSRMHFASAAAWWKSAPHDEHAHGPVNPTDVENWVQRSLDYVTCELQRLLAGVIPTLTAHGCPSTRASVRSRLTKAQTATLA